MFVLGLESGYTENMALGLRLYFNIYPCSRPYTDTVYPSSRPNTDTVYPSSSHVTDTVKPECELSDIVFRADLVIIVSTTIVI